MRTLIVGTSWVQGQASRYLFNLWWQSVRKLNPDTDIIVVDAHSPDIPQHEGLTVLDLGDNVGHHSRGGGDGWGRAFCRGLEYAIAGNYNYVAHIECDLLFSRPVTEIFQRMAQEGIKVCAPMAYPYQFVETALMFMDVRYVKESCFVDRYDWATAPKAPLPEQRVDSLMSDALWYIPLKGGRNDMDAVTARNISQISYDWITHCKDPAVYREFMRVHGLEG